MCRVGQEPKAGEGERGKREGGEVEERGGVYFKMFRIQCVLQKRGRGGGGSGEIKKNSISQLCMSAAR